MSMIKPIRTDEDLDAALARIEEIFDAQPDTPEDDELGVLLDLVEHYEDKRYPIGPPDPVAAIEFEMDQRGLTRQDLVPYIGSPDKVAAVLSRQEDITMPVARALHKHLGIAAETLLQEPLAEREQGD
jgi:HTH-type transcriptional regulator/antitoxin HigA